jgi:hypothetical protein
MNKGWRRQTIFLISRLAVAVVPSGSSGFIPPAPRPHPNLFPQAGTRGLDLRRGGLLGALLPALCPTSLHRQRQPPPTFRSDSIALLGRRSPISSRHPRSRRIAGQQVYGLTQSVSLALEVRRYFLEVQSILALSVAVRVVPRCLARLHSRRAVGFHPVGTPMTLGYVRLRRA